VAFGPPWWGRVAYLARVRYITLSGIVQQGGSLVTTDLTVGFEFHLPYLPCEGTPTSFVVTAGRNFMVNVILGLPFITQTNMVIDTSDSVAKLRAFDLPLFPIDFRCTMCAAPIFNKERAAANTALYANTINEINAILPHVSTKSDPSYLQKAQNTLRSIVLPTKWARFINVHDISSNSASSTASVGSAIDHAAEIAKADANAFDLDSYMISA
jgi:hypothetical protein